MRWAGEFRVDKDVLWLRNAEETGGEGHFEVLKPEAARQDLC